MYESHYRLTGKPFQLVPDPSFFFGSKGHKRATAYLDYGVSRGEGFIVITGEIGAGKTTLVRHLFQKLATEKIHPIQIVTTHLGADDMLRMVAAALNMPHTDSTKATLLVGIEGVLRQIDNQGKRVLLVIDEAQNLSPRAIEELRMLSNFQSETRSLLQTFLLGQPEFKTTMMRPGMEQLRQRVIATCHLGPMEPQETRDYIEHRLHTVGWNNYPSISDDAFVAIHDFCKGIPRKINTFCDRLMLLGYLEELSKLGIDQVQTIISDLRDEYHVTDTELAPMQQVATSNADPVLASVAEMNTRISGVEDAMASVLRAVKSMVDLFQPLKERIDKQ